MVFMRHERFERRTYISQIKFIFFLVSFISIWVALGLRTTWAQAEEADFKKAVQQAAEQNDSRKSKPFASPVKTNQIIGLVPLEKEANLAIENGLRYLAKSQLRSTGQIGTRYPVATTALSGLAFLGNGQIFGRGIYSSVLAGITAYLLEKSKEGSGFICEGEDGESRMYGHFYSVLFLTQLYGMMPDPNIRKEVEGAIRQGILILEKSQSHKGGWGYSPVRSHGEGTTTAGVLQALRAAFKAGFKVDVQVIQQAKKYLAESTNEDGSVNYTHEGGRPSYPLTAMAVTALNATGDYGESENIKKNIQYLKRNLFHNTGENVECINEECPHNNVTCSSSVSGVHCQYFYHFYATQSFWNLGGDDWRDYAEPSRKYLLSIQEKSGRWESRFGNEYATAMSVLALEVPKQFLPIFVK